MIKNIYILSAKRTPFGSFMGQLSEFKASKLGAIAIEAAVKESGVNAKDIEQVYMGNVLSAGMGQAPARQAAIYANLPKSVACTTVNKVCGSGMKAVMLAAQSIETGECDLVVAGGMENMTQVPFYMENTRNGYRMGHQKLVDGMIKDGLWDVYNDYHMGSAAELCAKEKNITRADQDAFAIESFKRAQDATKAGKFKSEMVAIQLPQKKGDPILMDQDEGPGKAQFDKIPGLKPVFDKQGSVTAANASTINDGAAALVLASEEYVKKHNLKPIAKLVAYAQHAQAPEWFTTAPVEAMRKVSAKSGWKLEDVELFEINEAFALVTMAAMRELNLPHAKVNVNGGAVSIGHPIGASGARILTTLIWALRNNGKKKGMASICIGGGEATAMTLEVM